MADTPHRVDIEGRRFQVVVTGPDSYRVVRLEELTGDGPHPVIVVLDNPIAHYGSTEEDAIRRGTELLKKILKEEQDAAS